MQQVCFLLEALEYLVLTPCLCCWWWWLRDNVAESFFKEAVTKGMGLEACQTLVEGLALNWFSGLPPSS